MIYIDNKELEAIYNMKKESAKKRLIPFHLSFEAFSALYKHRDEFTCFYTDKPFNLKDSSHDDYPSFERLLETQGNQEGNICLCTQRANRMKALYIECEKSMKGIGESNIRLVQRIRKVVENPVMIAERYKPYKELFDKVRQEQETIKEADSKTKQRIEENKILVDRKAKRDKLKLQMNNQLALVNKYKETFKEFEDSGAEFELTLKECRDALRKEYCSFTGEEFKSIEDKYLYVIDVSKPVTKTNIAVCTKQARDGIYHISGGDPEKLKVLTKTLTKTYM